LRNGAWFDCTTKLQNTHRTGARPKAVVEDDDGLWVAKFSRPDDCWNNTRVIATLGRVEDLRESGQLERLLRSGARFAAKAMLVEAAKDAAAITAAVRRIGPSLVFERLWEETGCRAVIETFADERKHGFALERAVFMTVLHRLFAGGSDRAADRWRQDYRIDGVEGPDLHHLYRAMAWLGEELPASEQDGRTPFAPRCLKDVIEERLFEHRRDLFRQLDLVFMDTTSLYFEGNGAYQKVAQSCCRAGKSGSFAGLVVPDRSHMWDGDTLRISTARGDEPPFESSRASRPSRAARLSDRWCSERHVTRLINQKPVGAVRSSTRTRSRDPSGAVSIAPTHPTLADAGSHSRHRMSARSGAERWGQWNFQK
jgi:hypothetical protein